MPMIQDATYESLKKRISNPESLKQLERLANANIFELLDNNDIIAFAGMIKRNWDSNYFGYPIYELIASSINNKASDSFYSALINYVLNEYGMNARCIIARIDATSSKIIRACENVGFRIFDFGCIFSRIGSKTMENSEIDAATPSDVWALIKMSSNIYSEDHFHQDEQFQRGAVNGMYGLWIRNLFYNDLTDIFVYRSNNEIQGFVTLRLIPNVNGESKFYVIDLIGVSPEVQGRGVGKHLLRQAIGNVDENAKIKVGTQISNTRAMNLYLSCGFSPNSYYATMHMWNEL